MGLDIALVAIILFALAVLLARHWPRPVVVAELPIAKNPCGFIW